MRERELVWESVCMCVPVHCLRASRIPNVAPMFPLLGVHHCCCSFLHSLPLMKMNCYNIPSSNKDCPQLWPVTTHLSMKTCMQAQ